MAIIRNGVLVAIVAHGLIGISLVWDKVLLKRPKTANLHSYVFWLGAISIFGLALLPFGFHMPSVHIALLAVGTGALNLLSVYFYMAALKAGEASEAPAIMGGFSPVATALIGAAFLPETLSRNQFAPFTLMTLGGFVMFFTERWNLRSILLYVLLASGTYGLTEVLQKVVFDETNFVSGYVFFTIGTFAAAMSMLVPPCWRREIFKYTEEAEPRSKFWYMVNRFMAGVGSFLIFYAISRTTPAMVEAITGVRYALIFVAAYWLTKFRPDLLQENYQGMVLWGKIAATALIVAGLVLSGLQEGGESASPTAGNRPSAMSHQLSVKSLWASGIQQPSASAVSHQPRAEPKKVYPRAAQGTGTQVSGAGGAAPKAHIIHQVRNSTGWAVYTDSPSTTPGSSVAYCRRLLQA